MKTKKPKKIITSIAKYKQYLLAYFVVLGFLICGIYFGFINQKTEAGQLQTGQTYSGENLSHSLDLRLAARAAYPSSALSLVKDLGKPAGVKTQIVSFGVPTDGLTEYGLLTEPSTPPPNGGYPVIILCHGYINPADYKTQFGYSQDMQFYSNHGFAVIKPDLRGQGLSFGQGHAEGAYYSMAYNTDVMSLISAIKATPYLDKSKINIWGHSMGAYIALRASVLSKDIKSTILLSGPVGSFKQIYLSYVPPSDENNPLALQIRNDIFSKYGTPAEGSAFWDDASVSNFLQNTNSNIQIHVGLQDVVVPPQLSADLDTKLTSINKNHQYYVYQDGRHSLIAQRSLVWARSLAILQK